MNAEHGGPDALGIPLHDFSTNANACGPCPQALAAIAQADAARYPEPAYAELRARLASFHGVSAQRIHLAASASEFIVRITAAVARRGGQGVAVPLPAYGDYARAAHAQGLTLMPASAAQLLWQCDPASPSGQSAELIEPAPGAVGVLDCAYAPLRLTGSARSCEALWQLWTPNKALGLTGLRAAYAIAPVDGDEALQELLDALMPSWPIGAHGVALLQSWTQPAVQQWLRDSLPLLRDWKASQVELCERLNWRCLASDASFFCAEPATKDGPAMLRHLRAQGIKLRDASSLGLPGHVRLNVLPPASQQALHTALVHWR